MNWHPSQISLLRRNRHKASIKAFSLLELLMVITIMVIVFAFIQPAMVNIQRSYQLSNGAVLIKDNLQFARQLAMTQNTSVIASFCKVKDAFNNETYHVLTLEQLKSDGTLTAAAKPVVLPNNIIITENSTWSSIMTLPQKSTSLFGNNSVVCRQIRFQASGMTDLDATSGKKWYLTLFYSQNPSATPTNNFVTLVIDPVTGRIVANQP